MSLARYEWGDAGRPALVCLHGVTSHGRHFEELAGRLSDRFHVVALDLRGHGGSPWEPPWNLEQHVADVLEAAPPEPAAWLGHSFGGRVAYEAAAAAPDRVERLVLLDPRSRSRPTSASPPRRTPAATAPTSPSRRGSIGVTRRAS